MTSDAPLESDRDLLARFRAGERDALTRVYRLYVQDVARTLRAGVVVEADGQRARVGRGLPDADVEGLVHDTFLRAFSPAARDGYDGLRPYGAYLATIARNILVDRARRLRRDARVLPVDDVDEIAADAEGAPHPTWRIEEGEIVDAVRRVAEQLAPAERTVFRARYEQKLSLRDAAARTGMSIITVRRIDARLRHRLLDLLRREGYLVDARIGIPSLRRDRSKG